MVKRNIGQQYLPAIVWQEEKWFVAKTLGLEIASQGLTKKQALENLKEAVELYFEDEDLNEISFPFISKPEFSKIYLS